MSQPDTWTLEYRYRDAVGEMYWDEIASGSWDHLQRIYERVAATDPDADSRLRYAPSVRAA